jgi:TolB protein
MKNIITSILFLWFISLLNSGCAQDKSTLLYSDEGHESAYPRLSKDDSRILFQSDKSGKWQLMIMDLLGNTPTPVMMDTYNNNFPDWSPDNKLIAFTSDRDGNEEIYIINTDGTGLNRITNDPGRDIHPYFSPDGQSLLFNSTRSNGSFDVFRYEFASGTLSQLTNTPSEETCARYSPDMKKIVMLKNDASSDDIYLMDENGSLKNITNTPSVLDGWPMFSYDSQWIYYSSMETGEHRLYRVRLDGREKTKLTDSGGAEDARVCISRDGSWLIYNKRLRDGIDIRRLNLS